MLEDQIVEMMAIPFLVIGFVAAWWLGLELNAVSGILATAMTAVSIVLLVTSFALAAHLVDSFRRSKF